LSLASVAVLGVLLFIQIVLAVVRQPFMIWNEIRWSRSLALAHGQTIYRGQNDPGPIVGTLHTPVSHVFYRLLTGWIGDPTQAILAGSMVSIVLVFGALAWLFIRRRSPGSAGWVGAALCFLWCAFGIMQSPSCYNVVVSVHTDACAVAFAIVACGLLCGLRPSSNSHARIWLCAGAVVLSVWSKQTMLPLAAALAVFIWLADGVGVLKRYLVAFVSLAAAVLCLTLAVVPASAFFFNVVTLATHRPRWIDAFTRLVGVFRTAKLEALGSLLPVLFFIIAGWDALRGQAAASRRLLVECRWLVFVFAAVSLTPGTIQAVATVGGDINHAGIVLCMLLTAAALAVQQNLPSAGRLVQRAASLFLIVGLLVNVTPAAAFGLPAAFERLADNPSEVAFRYASRNPNQAYFPWNPSVSLLTERKLYHFEMSLKDRELAGYPPSDEQVRSGLPSGVRFVAIPPGLRFYSKSLKSAFRDYRETKLPELPGWLVYEKPQ
jgi:hypothetical protein